MASFHPNLETRWWKSHSHSLYKKSPIFLFATRFHAPYVSICCHPRDCEQQRHMTEWRSATLRGMRRKQELVTAWSLLPAFSDSISYRQGSCANAYTDKMTHDERKRSNGEHERLLPASAMFLYTDAGFSQCHFTVVGAGRDVIPASDSILPVL